jgi:hypothetical protein
VSVYFEVNIYSCINKMKLLRFPIKGVGGLSLILSEAFVVVVVAIVSAISLSWYRRFVCQDFDMY